MNIGGSAACKCFAKLAFTFAISTVLTGCGGGGGTSIQTQTDSQPVTRISTLTVTPASFKLDLGVLSSVRAIATYTDGSSADVTGNAQWSSTPSGYVQITGNGTVLPLAVGSAKIDAQLASSQASADVAVMAPSLQGQLHQPLIDKYVWSNSASGPDQIRYFRGTFVLDNLPSVTTIYVAGPRYLIVWVNGVMVASGQIGADAPTLPLVVSADVSHALVAGRNVIAVACAYGDRVAAKLVAGGESVFGTTLESSDGTWKYSLSPDAGWQAVSFGDGAWPAVSVVGGLETDSGRFQGKADAELYRWPGYDGISGFLAHRSVHATAVLNLINGVGLIAGTDALTGSSPSEFTVSFSKVPANESEMPSLVLDFGRELNGRIALTSTTSEQSIVNVQYGESLGEALNDPYYGENRIVVPPQAQVYGPKAGFRYVLLRFVSGPPLLTFSDISADQIFYPVGYAGWFDSSDSTLNSIWQTAARTAHLNMQERVWDGIKRDRLPWMGDVYVTGKSVSYIFADQFLMKATLQELGHAASTADSDVNNIPGYSAFWVMGLSDYYRNTGDFDFVRSENADLDTIVAVMQRTIGPEGLFSFSANDEAFVDWSTGFFTDTQESRTTTQFALYKAFVEASFLYQELGETEASDNAASVALQMKSASEAYLFTTATGTYGSRWQTNAMAIYSAVANDTQRASIWTNVLSQPPAYPVTPYYTYFALEAMSEAGHEQAALDWIRGYWGGMVHAGATCFWEAYDPSWLQTDFHAALQADNTQGYYVSLCHGWSSGPAAWLMQHVLGVQRDVSTPEQVMIRPELLDLQSARGAIPTSSGTFYVTYRKTGTTMDGTIVVPPAAHAVLLLPVASGTNVATINGTTAHGSPTESGTRAQFALPNGGTYTFSASLP